VNLFDTAAMYSGGASERRLGELAQGRDVLIATKFPAGFRFGVLLRRRTQSRLPRARGHMTKVTVADAGGLRPTGVPPP
jgi:aryl-alcohol dehydrogenase-like predicted oxidoreductase